VKRGVPGLALTTLLCTSTALADAPKLSDLDSTEDWDAVLMMSPPDATSTEPAATIEPETPGDKPARRKGRKARAKKATGDSYKVLQSTWHEPAVEEDGSWGTPSEGGPPPLVLKSVANVEPVVITPASEEGGFDAAELAFASQLLGSWDGGPTADPRLLDLIYLAVRHFDVPFVRVVSGIRRDRKGSRHSHGLAADIVLPGVKDEDLAALFRAQGFVGVGVYTRAGFVHIDVRERSYFWVDTSAPGRRGRIRQVRADESKAADEAATARGLTPLVNPAPLQRALNTRAVVRNRRHKGEREKGVRPARSKEEKAQATRPQKRDASAQAAKDRKPASAPQAPKSDALKSESADTAQGG
jgi:hypothetical protein